jgi:hypothetical protein
VTLATECDYKLPVGSFVDIGAQGISGTEFDHWSGACAAFVNADCSFTTTTSNSIVYAYFQYTT